MGLLYDLETRLEQQIPAQLQRSLQQALDDYRPICSGYHLTMRRHHHQARAITTGYGVIGQQRPVFRGGERWQMTRGMALRGTEERYARYSKNREPAVKLAAPGLSYAQSGPWLGCVKSALCRWRRVRVRAPELQQSAVLEMDGLWTRTAAGATELRAIRDAEGVALVQDHIAAGTAQSGVAATGKEKMGTVGSPHNLTVLLQNRGLINQTT